MVDLMYYINFKHGGILEDATFERVDIRKRMIERYRRLLQSYLLTRVDKECHHTKCILDTFLMVIYGECYNCYSNICDDTNKCDDCDYIDPLSISLKELKELRFKSCDCKKCNPDNKHNICLCNECRG